jgi:hypothetical protein
MQGIGLIIFLAMVAWYWWDTMQSKEVARQAGKRACDQAGVQFLDDTVEKKKIWIRRNNRGRLEFCRIFFFEFATDGEYRYQGRVVVLGKTVSDVSMDAYRVS